MKPFKEKDVKRILRHTLNIAIFILPPIILSLAKAPLIILVLLFVAYLTHYIFLKKTEITRRIDDFRR